MRLTLDALIVLDAIDRKGSFAAAAEELHRVPSAITYTVQKLEQGLARRGRQLQRLCSPTEALEQYQPPR